MWSRSLYIWLASSWIWVIFFYCHCWNREQWKNFAFFSPSFSRCTLDFWRHRVYSCIFLSSSYWMILASLSMSKFWGPFRMMSYWTSLSKSSNSHCAWNMLPKTSQFQTLRCCLMRLSFCWKQYMCMSLITSTSCHHCVTFRSKSRWDSQNFSNLKGRLADIAAMSSCMSIGQWSEPAIGRMLEFIDSPWSRRDSLAKNRSKRQVIFWEPKRWLLQVEKPLEGSMPTNFFSWINSLNIWLLSSKHLTPPLFSSR